MRLCVPTATCGLQAFLKRLEFTVLVSQLALSIADLLFALAELAGIRRLCGLELPLQNANLLITLAKLAFVAIGVLQLTLELLNLFVAAFKRSDLLAKPRLCSFCAALELLDLFLATFERSSLLTEPRLCSFCASLEILDLLFAELECTLLLAQL